MKKTALFISFFLIVIGIYAQNINTYKYIIVPKKFSILKDTNQHQLNVLTKLLFKEAGFTAIYNDVFPDDLRSNNCLGLNVAIEEQSGIFNTKLKIILTDCKNAIVFTSKEGKSRKKDFKAAYQEALRKAFKSITALEYNYTPSATVKPKEEETTQQPTVKPTTEATTKPTKKPPIAKSENVLYAQPVANGFQLIDTTPRVLYIIQKTGLKDTYIIKDKNGILYKAATGWIVEYYQGDALIRETITVKF